ncbi:hypothetical protein P389DRAFT_76328 [Cystobasidium minutum MCA 4210]|uniref:uncharacterized protein n=1 Tax=Cystobasidium minutum MCA 4210 TaxID=1397322 RepID=UPI0034CDA475|eukprot:jgi/Rhomi1/76328/CE76327_208
MTRSTGSPLSSSSRAAASWLTLAALSALKTVSAIPCAAFDGTGTNAYVFGAPYGDLSLGSDLTDPSAFVSLTNKTGRPDFTGSNTQCFVNQFTNGLYVLGATNNSTNTAYIYDFISQSWSTQQLSGGPDPASYTAILDHDTNVLYAYANGTMNALAFDQSKAVATSSAIEWQTDAAVNAEPFDDTAAYQPVMGAANNHIQFFNTPGSSAGEGYIFVIHYAYWQPEAQSFGAALPNSFGQTVTILSNSSAAPNTFAFIPENGNGTYVVNAKSNTTEVYPGPSSSDSTARYGASTSGLLQVTGNGSLSFFNFGSGNQTWTSIDVSSFKTMNTSSTPANTSAAPSAASSTAVGLGPNAAAPSASVTGAAVSGMTVNAIPTLALSLVGLLAVLW